MSTLPPVPSASKANYQLYCGVDIAAKTFTAALCLPDDEPTKALSFKQQPEDFEKFKPYLLSNRLSPDQILVIMEATGSYWIELATFLALVGFGVSVTRPSRLHDFAKSLLLKAKNDFLDVQTLARLAMAQKPAKWTPPPPIYRELSQRLSRANPQFYYLPESPILSALCRFSPFRKKEWE